VTLQETASAKDPLRAALRTPSLCALYECWRELKAGGPVPPLGRFNPGLHEGFDRIFTVEVDRTVEPALFRFRHMGDTLVAQLGHFPGHEPFGLSGEEVLGTLEGAYRHCARTGSPSYEYARFDLGDGPPMLVERLLLPFSDDGQVVTYLLGMVILTNLSAPDPKAEAP
jgi:hypothetical protein